MQFIDLSAQQKCISDELNTAIQKVLQHGRYIMGPEVAELETTLASYVGTRHAIACSSGTDALLLALMVLKVGPGDAVLTSPFTFFATAEVISLLGATPVFVDIEPETFNIDPNQLDTAIKAVQDGNPTLYPLPRLRSGNPLRIKGVIAVDLYGLPADYHRIQEIAQAHGLTVLEDAAQSFGAEYHSRKACSLADMACTSFYPAKPLGAYGDAGMCFCDDDKMAEKMRSLVVHGEDRHKYDNVRIGINGRLDTLQAAILLTKFSIFPGECEARQRIARTYSALLDGSGLDLPKIPTWAKSAWAQYTVLAQSALHRDSLRAALKEAGIPTAIHYPKPLHLQPALTYLGYAKGDFPISEDCARRVFSLPMHPYLDATDQEKIAKVIKECRTG